MRCRPIGRSTGQFAYNPGTLTKVDKTDSFLLSFGLKDEPQAKRPAAGSQR